MKLIQTNSFKKIAVDFNRQPGSFPNENYPKQDSLFEQERDDVPSILDKWKKNKKVPTEKVYQFGVDVPAVKKN